VSEESKNHTQCLHCQRTEYEAPLMSVRYRGRQMWICVQCLPILIHNPSRLATNLPSGKDIMTGSLA